MSHSHFAFIIFGYLLPEYLSSLLLFLTFLLFFSFLPDSISRLLLSYQSSFSLFFSFLLRLACPMFKSLGLCLFFRFFSPSRLDVYMKHCPSLELSSSIKSAGNITSSGIMSTSPTYTLEEQISETLPSLFTFLTFMLFISII